MAKGMIIGITGKRLSGKTTVAEYLREKHGFIVLCFTEDLLKPMLLKRGKQVNRRNLIYLGQEIREKHKNKDALARMLSEKILPGKNYAISGIRFPEEVRYFRKRFRNDFVLVAVYASEKTRFQRAMSCKRFKESASRKEFFEVEKLPTESIIPKTMKMADFTIRNEGVKKNLERVMKQIISSQNTARAPRR